ncbi:MAG: hypothetical protein ACRC4N_10000, partial [Gammaproteobacteria bacterium]
MTKKEGQINWPLTGSNVSNVVPSQEVHHVGTNEVFPGKQVNNNHSHLNEQALFAESAKKLTTAKGGQSHQACR